MILLDFIVLQNNDNDSNRQHFRIFVLSPLPREEGNPLWIRHKAHDMPIPLWHKFRHPNITVFFYGDADQQAESILPTKDVHEAMVWLEKRYYIDFLVHVSGEVLFYHDVLFSRIKREFSGDALHSKPGFDSPRSESFLYHRRRYYHLDAFFAASGDIETVIKNYEERAKILADERPLQNYLNPAVPNAYELISLGGWCGPAVTLMATGVRQPKYPFNTIHSTLEGVMEVIKGNTEAYFRESEYTVSPHFNINNPALADKLQAQLALFSKMMRSEQPILFVRTVIAPDFRHSFRKCLELMDLIHERRSGTDRLLLLLHDQGIGTVKVTQLRHDIMVWAAHGKVGWNVPNRPGIIRNYAKAIEYCLDDQNWQYDEQQVKDHTITNHRSRGICKHLFDAPLLKILTRVQRVRQTNRLTFNFAGLYVAIKNNAISTKRGTKFGSGRGRGLQPGLEKVLQKVEVPNCEMLFIYNHECYVDFDFPVFAFSKGKSDPRNIYLYPLYSLTYNFYDRVFITLQNHVHRNKWMERKEEIFFVHIPNDPASKLLPATADDLFAPASWPLDMGTLCSHRYALSLQGSTPDPDLPKLLRSGCCIIVLEPKGRGYVYEFSEHFLPGEHYILVEYESGETGLVVQQRIRRAIATHDAEAIAQKCLAKANDVFSMDAILDRMGETLRVFVQDIEANEYSYQLNGIFHRTMISSSHAGLRVERLHAESIPVGRLFELMSAEAINKIEYEEVSP